MSTATAISERSVAETNVISTENPNNLSGFASPANVTMGSHCSWNNYQGTDNKLFFPSHDQISTKPVNNQAIQGIPSAPNQGPYNGNSQASQLPTDCLARREVLRVHFRLAQTANPATGTYTDNQVTWARDGAQNPRGVVFIVELK